MPSPGRRSPAQWLQCNTRCTALHGVASATFNPFSQSVPEMPSGLTVDSRKLSIPSFLPDFTDFLVESFLFHPRVVRLTVARRRTQNRTDPRLYGLSSYAILLSFKFGTHGADVIHVAHQVRRRTRTRRVIGNGGCWCSLLCLSASRLPRQTELLFHLLRLFRIVDGLTPGSGHGLKNRYRPCERNAYSKERTLVAQSIFASVFRFRLPTCC